MVLVEQWCSQSALYVLFLAWRCALSTRLTLFLFLRVLIGKFDIAMISNFKMSGFYSFITNNQPFFVSMTLGLRELSRIQSCINSETFCTRYWLYGDGGEMFWLTWHSVATLDAANQELTLVHRLSQCVWVFPASFRAISAKSRLLSTVYFWHTNLCDVVHFEWCTLGDLTRINCLVYPKKQKVCVCVCLYFTNNSAAKSWFLYKIYIFLSSRSCSLQHSSSFNSAYNIIEGYFPLIKLQSLSETKKKVE